MVTVMDMACHGHGLAAYAGVLHGIAAAWAASSAVLETALASLPCSRSASRRPAVPCRQQTCVAHGRKDALVSAER